MTDAEKLIWMFKEVHGDIDAESRNCYTEIEEDDHCNPVAVHVMKYGSLCWTATKLELVFDYLTKHLDAGGEK